MNRPFLKTVCRFQLWGGEGEAAVPVKETSADLSGSSPLVNSSYQKCDGRL